ncbi:MAG TPA: CpcT/CpeT family chromophore lyase [Steroidobacteraceae bacterium]|nr:CpcT/CpeT family chromophore lyase [Steroidobacteraceae bacterium]
MGERGAARRGARRAAAAACLVGFAALAGLAGCASHEPRLTEADLTRLLTLLPGHYDNQAQAESDARSGIHPAHVAILLVITHVFTPRLGHYVYYAQETAADDPRRVLSQKMYSFQLDETRGIVETLYEFVEPVRWRDGSKELFTGVQLEDVQAEGCQLLWKPRDAGWVASHDPKICPDAGGAAAAPQVELGVGTLNIGDYRFRKGR